MFWNYISHGVRKDVNDPQELPSSEDVTGENGVSHQMAAQTRGAGDSSAKFARSTHALYR